MASLFKNSQDYFDKATEIHDGKYSYDGEYKSLNQKINVTCPSHGVYQQLAHDHLKGHGCRKCHNEQSKTWSNEQDEFLKQNYEKGAFWCASKLKKTDCAIRGRAKFLGIAKPQQKINPNVPAPFWGSVISRALEDGFDLDFDSDFIWELYLKQNGKCALTGKPIKFEFGKTTRNTSVSLDRINSKKDYTKGNVQLTHKIVNRCKLNCPEDVFFAICKDVYLNTRDRFENTTLEWEMDIWNDREIPVSVITTTDYENLNFADFKRDKSKSLDR